MSFFQKISQWIQNVPWTTISVVSAGVIVWVSSIALLNQWSIWNESLVWMHGSFADGECNDSWTFDWEECSIWSSSWLCRQTNPSICQQVDDCPDTSSDFVCTNEWPSYCWIVNWSCENTSSCPFNTPTNECNAIEWCVYTDATFECVVEVCDDTWSIDEDNNGFSNCDDTTNCSNHPACQTWPECQTKGQSCDDWNWECSFVWEGSCVWDNGCEAFDNNEEDCDDPFDEVHNLNCNFQDELSCEPATPTIEDCSTPNIDEDWEGDGWGCDDTNSCSLEPECFDYGKQCNQSCTAVWNECLMWEWVCEPDGSWECNGVWICDYTTEETCNNAPWNEDCVWTPSGSSECSSTSCGSTQIDNYYCDYDEDLQSSDSINCTDTETNCELWDGQAAWWTYTCQTNQWLDQCDTDSWTTWPCPITCFDQPLQSSDLAATQSTCGDDNWIITITYWVNGSWSYVVSRQNQAWTISSSGVTTVLWNQLDYSIVDLPAGQYQITISWADNSCSDSSTNSILVWNNSSPQGGCQNTDWAPCWWLCWNDTWGFACWDQWQWICEDEPWLWACICSTPLYCDYDNDWLFPTTSNCSNDGVWPDNCSENTFCQDPDGTCNCQEWEGTDLCEIAGFTASQVWVCDESWATITVEVTSTNSTWAITYRLYDINAWWVWWSAPVLEATVTSTTHLFTWLVNWDYGVEILYQENDADGWICTAASNGFSEISIDDCSTIWECSNSSAFGFTVPPTSNENPFYCPYWIPVTLSPIPSNVWWDWEYTYRLFSWSVDPANQVQVITTWSTSITFDPLYNWVYEITVSYIENDADGWVCTVIRDQNDPSSTPETITWCEETITQCPDDLLSVGITSQQPTCEEWWVIEVSYSPNTAYDFEDIKSIRFVVASWANTNQSIIINGWRVNPSHTFTWLSFGTYTWSVLVDYTNENNQVSECYYSVSPSVVLNPAEWCDDICSDLEATVLVTPTTCNWNTLESWTFSADFSPYSWNIELYLNWNTQSPILTENWTIVSGELSSWIYTIVLPECWWFNRTFEILWPSECVDTCDDVWVWNFTPLITPDTSCSWWNWAVTINSNDASEFSITWISTTISWQILSSSQSPSSQITLWNMNSGIYTFKVTWNAPWNNACSIDFVDIEIPDSCEQPVTCGWVTITWIELSPTSCSDAWWSIQWDIHIPWWAQGIGPFEFYVNDELVLNTYATTFVQEGLVNSSYTPRLVYSINNNVCNSLWLWTDILASASTSVEVTNDESVCPMCQDTLWALGWTNLELHWRNWDTTLFDKFGNHEYYILHMAHPSCNAVDNRLDELYENVLSQSWRCWYSMLSFDDVFGWDAIDDILYSELDNPDAINYFSNNNYQYSFIDGDTNICDWTRIEWRPSNYDTCGYWSDRRDSAYWELATSFAEAFGVSTTSLTEPLWYEWVIKNNFFWWSTYMLIDRSWNIRIIPHQPEMIWFRWVDNLSPFCSASCEEVTQESDLPNKRQSCDEPLTCYPDEDNDGYVLDAPFTAGAWSCQCPYWSIDEEWISWMLFWRDWNIYDCNDNNSEVDYGFGCFEQDLCEDWIDNDLDGLVDIDDIEDCGYLTNWSDSDPASFLCDYDRDGVFSRSNTCQFDTAAECATLCTAPVFDSDPQNCCVRSLPNGSSADDNCAMQYNQEQFDYDNDGIGDVCDSNDDNDEFDDVEDRCSSPLKDCSRDSDNDGIDNDQDNCPTVADPTNACANAATSDTDNDGVLDTADNCPQIANPWQENLDWDTLGDICDADRDEDGIIDTSDVCIIVWLSHNSLDTDNDRLGDACDPDDDNDKIPDQEDNCQFKSNRNQSNVDGDSFWDVCDDDFVVDQCEFFVEQFDEQWNLLGQWCDKDEDQDEVPDSRDNALNCYNPADSDGIQEDITPPNGTPNGIWNSPSAWRYNADDDGVTNGCDPDSDWDWFNNLIDLCDFVHTTTIIDTDNDGIGDECDPCPTTEWTSCDTSQDTDNDTVPDSPDNCPSVANTNQANTDGDSFGDACDSCPTIPWTSCPTDSSWDNDGIEASIEDLAPNNWDINNDSIVDSTQNNVAWIVNTLSNSYVGLDITNTPWCSIRQFWIIPEENLSQQDSSRQYPFWLTAFTVDCWTPWATADIEIIYAWTHDTSDWSYRKFSPLSNTYTTISDQVTYSTLSYWSWVATVARFQVTDWWALDSDWVVNGSITDPAWPSILETNRYFGRSRSWRASSITQENIVCGIWYEKIWNYCKKLPKQKRQTLNKTVQKDIVIEEFEESPFAAKSITTITTRLQDTIKKINTACEWDPSTWYQRIQRMRDVSREDRTRAPFKLSLYCITSWYKKGFQDKALTSIWEAIKMIAKAHALTNWNTISMIKKNTWYRDAPATAWYSTYVNYAKDQWILNGLTNTHTNQNELKALTPISSAQFNMLLKNAGAKSIDNATSFLDQFTWLLHWSAWWVTRENAANDIVSAFPEVFADASLMVGNNIQVYRIILSQLQQKDAIRQEQYLRGIINKFKAWDTQYFSQIGIDIDVIVEVLESGLE